jgi:hypothetical protein
MLATLKGNADINLDFDPATRRMADLRHGDLRLHAKAAVQPMGEIDAEGQQVCVHELSLHGDGPV